MISQTSQRARVGLATLAVASVAACATSPANDAAQLAAVDYRATIASPGKPCDALAGFERDDVTDRLRRAGVRAAPVLDVGEALDSPDMAARRFVVRLPHAVVGERPLPGTAWVASRSSMRPVSAAPCLGSDTVPVLRDVLGLSDERIDALQEQGVLQ